MAVGFKNDFFAQAQSTLGATLGRPSGLLVR